MLNATTTAPQLALLHHALGVRPDRRDPFRNHFVAGDGHHDMPDLLKLTEDGYMVTGAAPAFCGYGDVVFYVTDKGRAHALDNLPLPPPPRKRSKFDEYYESESTLTFAEWLGIEVPRREYNYYASIGDPKRNFVRLTSRKATGEWCKSLKEAKASYKAALRERQRQNKAWSAYLREDA